MTKAIAHTYERTNEYRTHIAYGLIALCALLAGAYSANVYRVISRTVALQQVGTQAAAIGSAIDQLDAQYLQLSQSVTPDQLASYGMSQGSVAEYIPRTSVSGVAYLGH